MLQPLLRRYRTLFTLLAFAFMALAVAAITSVSGAATPLRTVPDEGIESLPPGTSIETILPNLTGRPVAMAFDPEGRLFYTEKMSGNVRLYANGTLQASPVINFPAQSGNFDERGLLGIAIDPDFATNHYIYVYWSCGSAGGCDPFENRLSRFEEQDGAGSNPVVIWSAPDSAASSIHNGGNIHFGPDGKLYITIGDDGDVPANAQNVAVKNGKIHRINSDGSPAPGNPVFSQPGALPSLFAMGLRNSWDFVIDPLTLPYPHYRLFASENGPSCDDEMNRIEGGYNYGWRNLYPCDDPNPNQIYNTIKPLWYLPRGYCCDAPTGITVYTGYQIPEWTNDLFMASHNYGKLRHFYLNAERTLVTRVNTVSGVTAMGDIETGPDGSFWYFQESPWYSQSSLKRIVGPGKSGAPTATSVQPATVTPTSTPTCPIQFTDVPSNHTFYAYVRCLACRDILSGYLCGREGEPCDGENNPYFRPGYNITRGQIAKVVANAASLTEDPGEPIYADVPSGHPFYAWINRLTLRGYMSGYPCGGEGEPCNGLNQPYFRPFNNVTRGQLSKITSNAANYSDTPVGQLFEDVPPAHPFYIWIQRLATRGIIGGYACESDPNEPCNPPDNRPYFRPGADITRGQASKIVANTFPGGCLLPARSVQSGYDHGPP